MLLLVIFLISNASSVVATDNPFTKFSISLTNIVEQELEKNLTPEDIAFVAYTKKAASEAINRAAYKFKLDQKDFKYFINLK